MAINLHEDFPWLYEKAFNNSMLDYLLSVCSFLAIWLTLIALTKYGLRKGRPLLGRFYPKADGFLQQVDEAINPAVFPLLAFHLAIKRLALNTTFEHSLDKIAVAVIIIQLTVILTRVASFLIMNAKFGRAENDFSVQSARLNLRAISTFVIWISAFLFFLSNLGIDITTFITGLGIGGIAIALAAQSVLGDVFSSFTLSLDKPFEIGDKIEFDGFTGHVERVGLKTTRVRSTHGEIVVVANSDLTKTKVKNLRQMHARKVKFLLGITYGTPAKVLRAIPDITKKIIDDTQDAVFERTTFLSFGESALNFEVNYAIMSADDALFAFVQQEINFRIVEEFEARKIEFAFPTRTIHLVNPLSSELIPQLSK